jgi:MFS transporter, MFS domain-containing protein family, molybdate-anion transporter
MVGAPVAAFGSFARTTALRGPRGLTELDSYHPLRITIRRLKQTELEMSVSGLLNVPRGGAISAITAAAKNWNTSPANYFNTSLLTLAILTVTFKIYQRASSSIDTGSSAPKKPKSVKDLQIKFLSVFWLLRCADWLQGPYFYEVYASKVFNGVPASLALVSRLFLTGFASTALFGPSVGRALDTFGRKKGTVAFSIIYAIGAISTKSSLLQVIFLGRIMSGIGTSLLFSAPESWLVGEAQKSGDDPDGSYLGETFGLVSGLGHCTYLRHVLMDS